METLILTAANERTREQTVGRAADLLLEGGVVSLPTETVYGLAALAGRAAALERLLSLKRRSPEKPLTRAFPSAAAAFQTVSRPSPLARRLAARYWPGPLTLVLPDRSGERLGLRVPGNELTRAILEQVGRPVVLPSANPEGEDPAIDAAQVVRYFPTGLDAVVDDGVAPLGKASTVVLATPDSFEVLREGVLTASEIGRTGIRRILFVCSGNTCRSPMAEALCKRAVAKAEEIEPSRLQQAGYVIGSAGASAGNGTAASAGAVHAINLRGLGLERHRSRLLTQELLAEQDHVFCMTAALKERLQETAADPGKVELLDPTGRDVVDPFGGSNEEYERCAEQLERAVAARVREIVSS